MTSFQALFRKELCDCLESKRFLVLFLLMALITAASLRGSIDVFVSQSLGEHTGEVTFNFLSIFTTQSGVLYSYASFIAFLGPLIGIALGFDAVNNERSLGTLNRLAAQPIFRDEIINAKFLASMVGIVVMVVPLVAVFTGSAILATGLTPGYEDAARILLFVLFTIVYIALWLAIAVLFSVLSRHTATSAIAPMGLWLLFTLFWQLIAVAAANVIRPADAASKDTEAIFANYSLAIGLSRISPYYLYVEASNTILNPSVRSVGVSTASAYEGSVESFLSFDQSVLLVWPHLAGMFALAVIGFGIAYISFMRQEIRA